MYALKQNFQQKLKGFEEVSFIEPKVAKASSEWNFIDGNTTYLQVVPYGTIATNVEMRGSNDGSHYYVLNTTQVDPKDSYWYSWEEYFFKEAKLGVSQNSNGGYITDKETGMYYLNARYYDPVTARFLSEDTYSGDMTDPLSLNLYTYCHNEPLMYYDPTGHSWEDIWGGVK